MQGYVRTAANHSKRAPRKKSDGRTHVLFLSQMFVIPVY